MKRVSQLLRRPHPVRTVASRLLWLTGLCRLFKSRLPGKIRVHFFPTSVSAALWVDPTFRAEEASFLRALVRPGDAVVDVGANIGQITLQCARGVGPDGVVVAIEPHPRTCRFLRANVRLNELHNVRISCCAVQDSGGHATFTDQRADDENRLDVEGSLEVPVMRLDELISAIGLGNRSFRLIKVDVEGAELLVFRGAETVLAKTTFLHFECSPDNLAHFGTDASDLLDHLRSMGFFLYRPVHGAWEQLRDGIVPSTSTNLLGVRDSATLPMVLTTGIDAEGGES